MRYITYEIISLPCVCVYKVVIRPGKIVGFGSTYKDALENALRFESKGLFAIDERYVKENRVVQRLR
jgi:hypothetical protein